MIIETAIFLGFVAVIAAIIIRAFEWQQELYYGPYVRPADELEGD